MAVTTAAAAPTQVRRLGPTPLPTLLLVLPLVLLATSPAGASPAPPRAQSSAPSPAAPPAHPGAQPAPPRDRHATGGANQGIIFRRTEPTEAAIPPPTQRNPPRTTGPTTHGRGQSDIIFPDSQYRPRFAGYRPACARGDSTFCEEGVDGYPMVHLNQVLGNSLGIREYFGNDSLDQNLVDRFGMNGEKSICASDEKIVFPKMGQNADGQWAFIVNLDNNFQQGIRVELCSAQDQPCLFSSALPDGSNAICRQKYIYRRLVSVGDGGEAKPDSFKIPSCCACYVNSEVTARILPPKESPVTKRRSRRHITRR